MTYLSNLSISCGFQTERSQQLKREQGEEVGEEVERRLQQMTMDDPGEDVALNLHNM